MHVGRSIRKRRETSWTEAGSMHSICPGSYLQQDSVHVSFRIAGVGCPCHTPARSSKQEQGYRGFGLNGGSLTVTAPAGGRSTRCSSSPTPTPGLGSSAGHWTPWQRPTPSLHRRKAHGLAASDCVLGTQPELLCDRCGAEVSRHRRWSETFRQSVGWRTSVGMSSLAKELTPCRKLWRWPVSS